MNSLLVRRYGVSGVAILCLLIGPAAGATVGPVKVTAASPYGSCTADDIGGQSGYNYPNSEVEPHLAVNPINALNLVAAHQQDRFSNGGSRGDVVEVSDDGGLIWSQVTVPGIAICDGGDWQRGTDPWLAFATNGRVYLVSQSFTGLGVGSREGFNVVRSDDGGHTWSSPVVIAEHIVAAPRYLDDDKVMLIADPNDASGDTVYMVWDRYVNANGWFNRQNDNPKFRYNGGRASVFMSKTIDGGQTWSAPKEIYRPGSNAWSTGPQLAIQPNGMIVLVTNIQVKTKYGAKYTYPVYMVATRSIDGGATWGTPTRIVRVAPSQVFDPITLQYIRAGGDYAPLAEVAVDAATGRLYLIWQDGGFDPAFCGFNWCTGNVFLSSSTDGRHWTTPYRIDKEAGSNPAFNPMIAVASDGTVGVSYSSFRTGHNAVSYWLVQCSANCESSGATWAETGLGGATDDSSFLLSEAPYAFGEFLGDYQGLTATSSGFQAFFALPGTSQATDASNVWFSAVP